MGLKSRRGFVFGRNVNLLDPFRGSKRSEIRDVLWLVSQIGRDFWGDERVLIPARVSFCLCRYFQHVSVFVVYPVIKVTL